MTKNVSYTFTVTATNSAGTSESSETSLSIKEAPGISLSGMVVLVLGMIGVLLVFLKKRRPQTQ